MSQEPNPSVARSLPAMPEFIAMIAALMALTSLSIDVMLPALPRIHDDYALAGMNDQQLVIVTYMAGFAIGQLFQGPLSDRFGRRPVLLIGLAVYALASFACLMSSSFEGLLVARALQGLANAGPRVVAIAVVRDAYSGRRMAEVMSFVMVVFIITPVLAPSIGGAFLLFGTWHLIFLFLGLAASAIAAWVAWHLPETHPAETRQPMTLAWLGHAFAKAATTRQTLGYTLAVSVSFGALMGYINSAQQVFLEIYDTGALFPVFFGGAAFALAIAALVNSRIVMRLGMRRIGHAACIGFAAVASFHAALHWLAGPQPFPVFLGLVALTLFFFGLVMPNYNALAMEPMGEIAGTASSFVGAASTGGGAIIGLMIGQRFDGTVGPLLFGLAAAGITSVIITLITEKGRMFHTGPARTAAAEVPPPGAH